MSRARPASAGSHDFLTLRSRFEDPLQVVELSGDLDLASRAAALHACTSAVCRDVLVDLSGLEFMDCAGYDALATAASNLERRGGSMVLMNPVGEPKQLLALIETLESRLCAPLRFTDQPVSCAGSARS